MNCFLELTSGLLTPLIAIITTYVAIQQYNLNKKDSRLSIEFEEHNEKLERNKLKLELYNKRYRIFQLSKDMLYKNYTEKVTQIEIKNFKLSTNESSFLFESDITLYVEKIRQKAFALMHMRGKLEDEPFNYPPGSAKQRKLSEEKGDLEDWFRFEYENVEMQFERYLSLKNLD